VSRDGIRTSGRAPGPLALRWLQPLDGLDEKVRDRLLRGKTLARAGRIVELEIAPGTVFAEVADNGTWHALLRVPTYEEEQWREVLGALTARLDRLARLLEGELDLDLIADGEARGVSLFPESGEVETDCDCGDWASPCAHGAALHHLVAEALEGDPLLLFTLRGRTR
jgi:uncharacterized Zn finger protein